MAPSADRPPCATTASATTTKRQHEQRLALDADRARNNRNLPFTLPVLEDASSIQVALTQIMRLLAAGRIDRKTASLMLYALQIANTDLQDAALEKLP
jgi:hypothetical protein